MIGSRLDDLSGLFRFRCSQFADLIEALCDSVVVRGSHSECLGSRDQWVSLALIGAVRAHGLAEGTKHFETLNERLERKRSTIASLPPNIRTLSVPKDVQRNCHTGGETGDNIYVLLSWMKTHLSHTDSFVGCHNLAAAVECRITVITEMASGQSTVLRQLLQGHSLVS